jgi:hypothetical protein
MDVLRFVMTNAITCAAFYVCVLERLWRLWMAAAIFGKDGFRRKDSSCYQPVVKPQPQPKHLS